MNAQQHLYYKNNLTKFLALQPDTPDKYIHELCQMRIEKYKKYLKEDPYDAHISYISYQLERLYLRFAKSLN